MKGGARSAARGAVPAASPPGARSAEGMRGAALGAGTALEPVRVALLRRARRRAEAIVAHAAERAAAEVAAARDDAERHVVAAARMGREEAAPLAAAARGQGRRDGRALVLGAQRDVLDELRARTREAAAGLVGTPEYPVLLAGLRATAQRVAGPGAVVTEHPDGGAVARGPGVVVDCSLPRLAEEAVRVLGPEVSRLWSAGRAGRRRPGGPGRAG